MTQPPVESIKSSLRQLALLQAVDTKAKTIGDLEDELDRGVDNTTISKLGVLLCKIPLEPRAAKILLAAAKADALHMGIMIVASMGVPELYDDEKFRA